MWRAWVIGLGLGLVLASALTGGLLHGQERPAAPPEEKSWTADQSSQLVFFAVLEGLYVDGVTNDVLADLIPTNPKTRKPNFTAHFVYTCPLCQPALEALRVYQARSPFIGFRSPAPNTFGRGLDPAVREQLRSTVLSERMDALQGLIQKWVQRRFDLMRLTPEERAFWLGEIEQARNTCAAALKNFRAKKTFGDSYEDWTHCAVCDGCLAACKQGP